MDPVEIIKAAAQELAQSDRFRDSLTELGSKLVDVLPELSLQQHFQILAQKTGLERICLLSLYIEVAQKRQNLGVELVVQYLSERIHQDVLTLEDLLAFAENEPLYSGYLDQLDAEMAKRHRDQRLEIVMRHMPDLLKTSRETQRGLGVVLTDDLEIAAARLVDEKSRERGISLAAQERAEIEQQARSQVMDLVQAELFSEESTAPRMDGLRKWIKSSTAVEMTQGDTGLDLAARFHDRALGIRDFLHTRTASLDEAMALTVNDDVSLFGRCFSLLLDRQEAAQAWSLLQRFRSRLMLKDAGAADPLLFPYERVRSELAVKGAPPVSLVEYVRDGNVHYAVLTQPSFPEPRIVRFNLGTKVETIARALFSQRSRLQRGSFRTGIMSGCEIELLAKLSPLVDWLPDYVASGDHVCFVPYGSLHSIPLHAIPLAISPRVEYVIEKYSVSYLPAANFVSVSRPVTQPSREALVVGAEYANREEDLRKHLKTVALILEQAGMRVSRKEQQEATVEEVIQTAGQRSWALLYLHGHGCFNEREPWSSGVVLSNGTHVPMDPQGVASCFLPASLLRETGLTGDLAVAAFCVSGQSEVRPGEEAIGVLWGLLTKGFASVVTALWDYQADAGRYLMEDFLGRWLRGQSKAQALAEAQRSFLSSNQGSKQSHPYFWAPFVLVGDWS